MPRVRQRALLRLRRGHHERPQRPRDLRGCPHQRPERAVGGAGGQGDPPSVPRLRREHAVREKVDERGGLPDRAGDRGDGGPAQRAAETRAFERAQESFPRRNLTSIRSVGPSVPVGVHVRGAGGCAAHDAARVTIHACPRGGVMPVIGDGLGQRGDPPVHHAGILRFEDEGKL